MLKYPAIFSIDFVFSLIEGDFSSAVAVFSAVASPLPCASTRSVQGNIADATAITTAKRFNISPASKFTTFK
jgi:hypothetical protein